MRGFKYWLQHKGITVIFRLAVAVLIVLVVCSYIIPTTVPTPGEQQTTPLPWAADLCMAYIGAYFFHYLVVVLPGRSKLESRLKTLEVPLTTIAFNGLDLVREMERIAKCPHRRITPKHLVLVLNEFDYSNPHIKSQFAWRMKRCREAYQEIAPYTADLPLDLHELLQAERKHSVHELFPDSEDKFKNSLLSDLRTIDKAWGPKKEDDFMVRFILSYYKTTEAVRESLAKHIPSVGTTLAREKIRERGAWPWERPGRTSHYFGLFLNPKYPYWDYPRPRRNYVEEEWDTLDLSVDRYVKPEED